MGVGETAMGHAVPTPYAYDPLCWLVPGATWLHGPVGTFLLCVLVIDGGSAIIAALAGNLRSSGNGTDVVPWIHDRAFWLGTGLLVPAIVAAARVYYAALAAPGSRAIWLEILGPWSAWIFGPTLTAVTVAIAVNCAAIGAHSNAKVQEAKYWDDPEQYHGVPAPAWLRRVLPYTLRLARIAINTFAYVIGFHCVIRVVAGNACILWTLARTPEALYRWMSPTEPKLGLSGICLALSSSAWVCSGFLLFAAIFMASEHEVHTSRGKRWDPRRQRMDAAVVLIAVVAMLAFAGLPTYYMSVTMESFKVQKRSSLLRDATAEYQSTTRSVAERELLLAARMTAIANLDRVSTLPIDAESPIVALSILSGLWTIVPGFVRFMKEPMGGLRRQAAVTV